MLLRRLPTILIFLSALIIGGLILRFWQLSAVPVSYYHDELDHVFTGEAVARFGTDITGRWNPWQLRPLQTINLTAELPVLFHAATQKVVGYGPENGHLTNAIFGIATAVLVVVLFLILTRDWLLSLCSGTLLLINPWHVHLSRMTYEAAISLFFQLALITSVCLAIMYRGTSLPRKLLILLSIISSFFFGYFTYHAAKFTLPALAVAGVGLIWYLKKASNKDGKVASSTSWAIIISAILLLLVVTHLGYSTTQQGGLHTRSTELVFNTAYLERLVDEQRRLSMSLPGINLVINKPAVLLREMAQRYFFVFDVYRLVLEGLEGGFQFSLIVFGFFYITQLVLIVTGIWWLVKRFPIAAVITSTFLAVSPVASVITISYQAMFRSALTYTLLSAISGVGLYVLLKDLVKISWHPQHLARLGVLLFLLIEVGLFGYHYFARYPVISADNHYFPDELLAAYVLKTTGPRLVVTTGEPYSKARSIISYGHLMGELNQEERDQFSNPATTEMRIDDIYITTDCVNLTDYANYVQIIEANKIPECDYQAYLATTSADVVITGGEKQVKLRSLSSPIDSGTYFYMLNDELCPPELVESFIYVDNIAAFNPLQLPTEEFCRTWTKSQNFNIPLKPTIK